MAFGFRRLPGAARNYEVINADGFTPGQTLSRRQYDAYVKRLGARGTLPGFAQIREAERELELLAERLAREESRTGSEFEREALSQARQSAAARAKALSGAKLRRQRQEAGQRRYNTLLKSYREERRRQGKPVSYREAQQSAEFKTIVRDMKGKPNPKGDPNIADENRFNRLKALSRLGGDLAFREKYNTLYGRVVEPVTNNRGETFNRIILPNGRSVISRRQAA